MFRKLRWVFLLILMSLQLSSQKTDTLLEGMLTRKEENAAFRYVLEKEKKLTQESSPWEKMYVHTRLSSLYHGQGKYLLAEIYSRKALQQASLAKDSILWAEALQGLASAYLVKRNIDTVKLLVDQISSFAERKNNFYLKRISYSLKGSILMNSQKESDAIVFYHKALSITRAHHLQRHLPDDLLRVATAYLLTEPKKGVPYLNEALEESIKRRDTSVIAMCYGAKAMLALIQNEAENWKKHVSKSLELALAVNHAPTVLYAYMQMLDFHLHNMEFTTAYQIGIKSIRFAKEESIHTFDLYIYQKMFEICKTLQKKDEAIQYLEEYVRIKTKSIREDQDAIMNMLKLQHELQENKLQLSNKELALGNAQKRNLLLLTINVLLLCLGIAYYLIRRTQKQHIHHLYAKEKLVEQWIAEERLLRQEVTQKEILTATSSDRIPAKTSGEDDEKNSKSCLFKELILTIEKEKLYLNPELNQKNVISILATNRNYLNKAIQSNSDENFKQIINRYRVEEAKNFIRRAVEAGELGGLEQFYTASGFNSETSFYRAFKYFTGLTPKEYAREYAQDIRS